jgi:murein DD-endopeptidase MepM/ murein hydrolase activator NlpD
MTPVPDSPSVDTPYGRRGSYWSCDKDSHGDGIHTGVDYACAAGTKVVAARPGSLVHSNHGSSFGSHQVDVICDDGTRDFYAHMRSRTATGYVHAGDKVGEVGSEGNATGPHLHFERHATTTGGWSCAVVRDPQPSIDWEDEDEMNDKDWQKMQSMLDSTVQKVWDYKTEVTKPSGDKESKRASQIIKETWQKVAKAK